MSPVLTIRTFYTFVVLLGISSATYGSGENYVSFQQTNGRGLPQQYEGSSLLMGATETSTYDLQASFDNTTTTALRTRASMTVSGQSQLDPDLFTLWKSIETSARATDTLVDFAVVQGVAGAGTVEFHWTVSGNTMLGLQQNSKVNVELLSGLTIFSASPGDVLLNEFHDGGGGNYELNFPVGAQSIVFPVDWEGGVEIPVVFELSSRVDLKVHNLYSDDFNESGVFTAELAAEFGNSAVLNGVLIRDMAGQPMPGATLVSRDGTFTYPIVPEPGCGILMLLGAAAMAVTARDRRRFRG